MNTALKSKSDSENWSLVIQPQRSLLDLRLGELWRYKDLVLLFVRRDFVAVYKQTILGPLWYLIQPLLTTVIFTFVFGNIASLPTDGLPQFLFYKRSRLICKECAGDSHLRSDCHLPAQSLHMSQDLYRTNYLCCHYEIASGKIPSHLIPKGE